jgi:hypothetical protein
MLKNADRFNSVFFKSAESSKSGLIDEKRENPLSIPLKTGKPKRF